MAHRIRSAYVVSERPSRAELALDDAEIAARIRRDRDRRERVYATPGEAAEGIMAEISDDPQGRQPQRRTAPGLAAVR